MKKKPPFNENATIRSAIRRVFSRSPIVREVMLKGRKEFPKFNKDGSRSKKDSVCYLCAVCNQYVGSTKVSVDHIMPVISIDDGFQDWNEFVHRLFCSVDNLQIICDSDHQLKTNRERFARQFKQDQQTISTIELFFGNYKPEEIKKVLAKYTPKRLLLYPQDFVDRVVALKARLNGTKTKKSKLSKGKI